MEWEPSARQVRSLERRLRLVQGVREYRRVLAVLEVARGSPIAQVSRQLGVSRQSIYTWIELYRAGNDPKQLRESEQLGRPSVWTEGLEAALEEALNQKPDDWDYQATGWTVGLLQHHLEAQTGDKPSVSSLRRQLHEMGYVWKRARYVLEPDPQREKKTPDSPKTLGFAAARRHPV